MSTDALREIFFEECEELMESLASNLELVSADEWDSETVNAIFRAVHSIKGAAGAFGFSDLVDFAHHYETVLDQVRSETLSLQNDVLRLVVRSSDVLAELIDCARVDGSPLPATLDGVTAELAALARDTAESEPAKAAEEEDLVFAPTPFEFAPIQLDLDPPTGFTVRLRPFASMYVSGHEPVRLIHALRRFGELRIDCTSDPLPTLNDFDFHDNYLSWTIEVDGEASESDIRKVFEFVDGLCELQIEPRLADVQTAADPVDQGDDEPHQKEAPPSVAPAPASSSAKERAPQANARATPVKTTLRVDPERVDRLINSVGELIINHAVIDRNLQESDLTSNAEMMAALDDYGSLAREIQEAVMAIRAQPVKSLFQRMGRVVREASEATGKDIAFITEGESTEIDKTMLERLSDPLTHMLRNAADHGIETPEARLAAGKSPKGQVKLSASHRSGHVVIEISDDGAGLDREKILAKAVQKGLVTADPNLSDSEVYSLLFAPGFSTAENVTNLSGRGVGMDVVKTAITSLGGKVGISSVRGEGSVFSITLPLTLAVLDGMIVEVSGETMVLPLSSIVETVRTSPDEIHEVAPGEFVLAVRQSYVPIIDLNAILGLRRATERHRSGAYVLLESNETTFSVAVDSIQDQRQVVIKSLKENYGVVEGISAATILGDGNVALILDPDALMDITSRQRSMRPEIELEGQI